MQRVLVRDVVHRQELDRGHPEVAEVLERRVRREPGVGAAQVVPHPLELPGETLHVQLVDHGLRPGPTEAHVALPVEGPVDHDTVRDRGGGVRGVGSVLAARRIRERPRPVVGDRPVDRLRVRVDQELRRVEAVPGARVPEAVHPVAVPLARPHARKVRVPHVRRVLAELDPFLRSGLVEQAELDPLGVLAEEGEVRPVAVPRRAERKRPPGPDGATHRSTLPAALDGPGLRRAAHTLGSTGADAGGYPAASALRSPRSAQTTKTVIRPSPAANASATSVGAPDMKPRPASSTYVMGL